MCSEEGDVTLSRTNQLSRESSKLTRVAIVSHYTRKLSDTRLQEQQQGCGRSGVHCSGASHAKTRAPWEDTDMLHTVV